MKLTFEVKKAKSEWRGPYEVYENGDKIFEGNKYQCELYIKARKEGFSILDATMGAAKRKEPPYKVVKVYLD